MISLNFSLTLVLEYLNLLPYFFYHRDYNARVVGFGFIPAVVLA